MADLDKIVEELGQLTLLEAADLTKKLEEAWGVSAAAPMAMGMMPGMMPGGAAAEEEEEKTEFDVVLTDIGAKKIEVIKAVRALTSLGLKEAKEVVEGLGTVLEGTGKDAATEAKKSLEEAGAAAEIR